MQYHVFHGFGKRFREGCVCGRTSSQAFTLFEILILAVLILTLFSIGLSFLKTSSNARMASCMLQQKQIFKATLSYNHDGDELKANQKWVNQLLPYLDNKSKIFDCPEDTQEIPNVIIEAQIHVISEYGDIYYLNIFNGPFARKLSETQYQQLRQTYGNLPNNPNLRPWKPYFDGSGPLTYSGFVPDENKSFWITMEDIQQEGSPGGDKDFDDIVLHIVPIEGGLVRVDKPYKGTTGYTLSLVDPYSKAFLIEDIGFKETRSAVVGTSNADYGINMHHRRQSPANQIFLMDFKRILINPENHWQAFATPTSFTFARHNDMVNVTFADGHAESLDPYSITPEKDENKFQFWVNNK